MAKTTKNTSAAVTTEADAVRALNAVSAAKFSALGDEFIARIAQSKSAASKAHLLECAQDCYKLAEHYTPEAEEETAAK